MPEAVSHELYRIVISTGALVHIGNSIKVTVSILEKVDISAKNLTITIENGRPKLRQFKISNPRVERV